jgi:hypothetical protein
MKRAFAPPLGVVFRRMLMELHRREFAALMMGAAAGLSVVGTANAEADPLPSWDDGSAKDAILRFVRATTDSTSPDFIPLEERIAEFDEDGTLWVEHPVYTQIATQTVASRSNGSRELELVESVLRKLRVFDHARD